MGISRKLLVAGTGLCMLGGKVALGQPTTAPSQEDLAQQVQELRAEVQELKTRLDAEEAAKNAPATASAPAANSSQQAIATNAGSATPSGPAGTNLRAGQSPQSNQPASKNMLADLHAGYNLDKGFIIQSGDGNFLLHPWAFFQFRNATNYRDHSSTGGSDAENGFEMPRAKFILDGNVFTPDLTYQVIWATSDTTGDLQLQDAWARYHFPDTPFAVEGGQIRDPVDHEQIMFATKTLTPERSIVNNVLLNGDDIVKGAEISYGYDQDSPLRDAFAVTSGERNFDTTFQDYPTNTADWGLANRLEWKLTGNWKDYDQFTALKDKEPLLVLGGGFDYTAAGGTSALTHVADVQYDLPSGFSIYGAYLGRYTSDNAGPPTTNGQFTSTSMGRTDTYDSTVRLMVAQLIHQHLEPFVRYEYLHFDSAEVPAGTDASINDITIGANYYFYGHRAKLTGAASYLPNGSPVSNTLGDLLTTHRGAEVILQIQFQLMI